MVLYLLFDFILSSLSDGALVLTPLKRYSINLPKGFEMFVMKKTLRPTLIAQGSVKMANCQPNSGPCGRPCNPPGPGGHR